MKTESMRPIEIRGDPLFPANQTKARPRPPLSALLLILGGPLALVVVEIIHPHPHELFELDAKLWLAVHYAQIPLFPLAALTMTALVRGQSGWAPVVSRVTMFLFGVSYIAFDTVAGVVTGILLNAAHASGAPERWREPIELIWKHPIMGGFQTPFLAIFGSVAWTIGALATALSIKRAGCSWLPVGLLVVSALALPIFKSHSWPGGPIAFGSLGAAAFVLWKQARSV